MSFGQTMSPNVFYAIKVVGSVKITSERILKDEEGGSLYHVCYRTEKKILS